MGRLFGLPWRGAIEAGLFDDQRDGVIGIDVGTCEVMEPVAKGCPDGSGDVTVGDLRPRPRIDHHALAWQVADLHNLRGRR